MMFAKDWGKMITFIRMEGQCQDRPDCMPWPRA